jgi:UDPglucose 6-dehydrogenase
MKKISVIGTGYVGLVTGVCFAELGHQVSCIDIDKEKVERLKKGISPIYEPGIENLLLKNIKKGRIKFFDNTKEGVADAEVIFIAVGTPSKDDGTVEIKYVERAAEDIAKALQKYAVIVNKSTVPVGTGERVLEIISKNTKVKFDVVSNPEFLREGQAISDFMKPDRVVIGVESKKARLIMEELYAKIKTKTLFTKIKTAEMIKYASNAYLATSISFINDLSELCEKVGANVDDVAEGMKLDKRIGERAFLSAGAGYGGSCFPKDVKGLISIAKNNGTSLALLEKVEEINKRQGERVMAKVQKVLGDVKAKPDLSGRPSPEGFRDKKVAVWGLAFKPETDDLRESPAVNLIESLLRQGANVVCFDPVAEENGQKILPQITFGENPLNMLKDVDCLVIMTEWKQFKDIKLSKIKKNLGCANIVDARNIYRKAEAEKLGFKYEGIGQ